MRKTTMTVALVALLVALFVTAAYALTGTSGADDLVDPSSGNDSIYGAGGPDDIFGDYQQDGVADNDADLVAGNRGADFASGRDKDTLDTVKGNRGSDICVIDRNVSSGAKDTLGGGCETVRTRDYDPTP